MIEYYFLFFLALVYLVVASIQDIKKTEVENWITISLGFFAIAYRAFHSIDKSNFNFLFMGIIGVILFYSVGNLFYYMKAFGGADVKLLAGIGAVLPYGSYKSIFYVALFFIILMFFVAFIYSFIYSIFLSYRNKDRIKKEFYINFKKYKFVVLFSLFFSIFIFLLLSHFEENMLGMYYSLFVVIMAFLFLYLKSLDKCMIKLTSYKDLREGDWLINDIKVGRDLIKNTAHGLTKEDILILKKNKKNIYIKNGIPFVPAILISFILMVFFYLTLGQKILLLVFGV